MTSRPLQGLLLLTLAACGGGYTVPAAHVTNAQNAIATATGAGAAQDPQAELHLRLAQDELSSAKASIARGDPEHADMQLLRARSDAELALSLAQEASAKAEAQQVIDRIRAMSAAQP